MILPLAGGDNFWCNVRRCVSDHGRDSNSYVSHFRSRGHRPARPMICTLIRSRPCASRAYLIGSSDRQTRIARCSPVFEMALRFDILRRLICFGMTQCSGFLPVNCRHRQFTCPTCGADAGLPLRDGPIIVSTLSQQSSWCIDCAAKSTLDNARFRAGAGL
jgi:hypothetical protein